MMDTKLWLLVGLVIILAIIGIFMSQGSGDLAIETVDSRAATVSTVPSVSVFPEITTLASVSAPMTVNHVITYRSLGLDPVSVNVRAGEIVTFINLDPNARHWPVSDPHPTGNICPWLNAGKPLAQNESYSLTFTEVKTCPFHDYLANGDKRFNGTIIVK